MIRLVTTALLTLALAATLGGCAKRGRLEAPPDSTAGRSYPAPSPGATRAAEPVPVPVPADPFLGAVAPPGSTPSPMTNLPE